MFDSVMACVKDCACLFYTVDHQHHQQPAYCRAAASEQEADVAEQQPLTSQFAATHTTQQRQHVETEAAYEAETEARRDAGAPPFGRYAAIVVSSEEQACAHEVARAVAQSAPRVDGMAVYGPAPAPLAMLRGRHRYRLLVHARRALDVQDVIRDWLGGLDWPAKARVTVDVDPYNFL